ncbi:MAG: hypothetical protein IT423_00770, partial [Pirellulaceae bacterium]|nr:hypothetical protein [Pirellulaceae bacterium]
MISRLHGWHGGLLACMACGLLLSQPTLFARDSDAMEFTKDSLDTVKKYLAEGKAVLVDVRGLIEWN